jgi:hypothetical protein
MMIAQMSAVVAVALGALVMCPALAAERDCFTPEQRDARLSELIEAVDALRRGIERVPPSEAEFIRREFDEALSQDNHARASILINNPHYHPLQVHDAVDRVVDHLKRAQRKGVKEQASEVVSALGAYGGAVASLDSYIEFDSRRAQKVLDLAAREDLGIRKTLLPGVVGLFAQCLISQLREP